jgi:hypothetical protein
VIPKAGAAEREESVERGWEDAILRPGGLPEQIRIHGGSFLLRGYDI